MPELIKSLPYNHPVEKVVVILVDLRNLEGKTTQRVSESLSAAMPSSISQTALLTEHNMAKGGD